MIRINFFGDFRICDVSRLRFGDELQALLNAGDINLLNFEAPIFVEGAEKVSKSGPNLYQDQKAPKALQDFGFNVISLANNHMLDYGEVAACETISSFDKAITLGCGKWEDAFRVKVIEIDGIRIGFLAITQHEFGAFSDQFYEDDNYGTASMSHPVVDELILESREKVDYLFIIPHAGMEHCIQPWPQLVTLYRHFINMGASGVIGGHPHVPQPWEIYKDCPIFYSLGNFCFELASSTGNEPNDWYNSLVASLTIKDGAVSVDLHWAYYDNKAHLVNLCDGDKNHIAYMEQVCADFRDKSKYKSIINNHAKSMAASYDYSFSENGFFKFGFSRYMRLLLSYFYRTLPGKQKRQFDSSHLLNDFQCEVHRWTIWHLLRNKDF